MSYFISNGSQGNRSALIGMHRQPSLRFVLVGVIVSGSGLGNAGNAQQPWFLWNHVGKAGGGTIESRKAYLKHQGLPVPPSKTCHPAPCINPKKTRYKHGAVPWPGGVLINVRDPVARFVSAFDWAAALLCKEMNETRKPTSGAFNNPGTRCKIHSRKTGVNSDEELHMIMNKYAKDANRLAEALCSSPEEAQHDVGIILHAKDHLVDHLGGADFFRAAVADNVTFYVIPLLEEPESKRTFFPFIDSAFRALTNNHRDPRWKRSQDRTTTNNSPPSKHSSVAWRSPSVLTGEGKCCVARFYEEDYNILPELAQAGCRGSLADNCTTALLGMAQAYNSRCFAR